MTGSELLWPLSDSGVVARHRRHQSGYREDVLRLYAGSDGRPGKDGNPRLLGNFLPEGEQRANFLSDEAAAYVAARVPVVRKSAGQLQEDRLYRNMLSSMPLCFNVFGHLRSYPEAALPVLSVLAGQEIAALEDVTVEGRQIDGIECEWSPPKAAHLDDGTAFDAVAATRTVDGRSLLLAIECKYVDAFSAVGAEERTPEKDEKYAARCAELGMRAESYRGLNRNATKQLLRNLLLAESVRRGRGGGPTFDAATVVVLARHDDRGAQASVAEVDAARDTMPTTLRFSSHRELADVAQAQPAVARWATEFRRRYVLI